MIKKSIYPKTNRICNNEITYEITEKIDGSNLVFAKLNGELLICQRNYILTRDELDKHNSYAGLRGWLDEYGDTLLNILNEKSAICGEWIAFGKIKYDLKNVIYKREYFKYPFENQIFPDFIDIVPLVSILNTDPSIEDLDILYDTYINNQQRHVEGFIIIDNTFKNIQKYVRYKDGKATPHILN